MISYINQKDENYWNNLEKKKLKGKIDESKLFEVGGRSWSQT